MSFRRVIFKGVVGKICMRSQRNKADSNASHKEDEPMRQSQHIFFNPGAGRLPILIFNFINTQNLIDRRHYISKNVVFGNHVRISQSAIDNDKLIGIFVVPDDPIDPVSHKFEVMVWLSRGEEKVDLSILMLQYQFSSVFVGEYPQNGIVRFMLHNNTFVLNVIVLQSVGIVEVYQKHLGHEELHNLPIPLNRKNPLLWFPLNFNQVNFVLVIENSSPSIPNFHLLDVVLALDLVHLLPSWQQHLISKPSVEFDCVSQSGGHVIRTQGYTNRLKRQTYVCYQLPSLFWWTAQDNNLSEWTQQSHQFVVGADESGSRQDVAKYHAIAGGDAESISVGWKSQSCNFATPLRQVKGLLLDFLPIAQTDDFDLVLSSQCQFVVRVVDSHSLQRSIEHPLTFDLVLHLLLVGWYVTVISLRKTNNDVAVSIVLVIYYFPVFGFEHQFERCRSIRRNIMDQQCFLIEYAANSSLLFPSFLSFHCHPFQISRFRLNCQRVSCVVGGMTADSDKSVLTARHKQTLAVPVTTYHLFWMLAHRWHFPFVLFVVEIQVALLVAAGQDRVGQRPSHPRDRLLLVFEDKLVDHAGGEGSP